MSGIVRKKCCCNPDLFLQARACGTGELVNLYSYVGDLAWAYSWDNFDPAVLESIGSGILSFDESGRLYFARGLTCYYFDLADQLTFGEIPVLARWLAALYWPGTYQQAFPCSEFETVETCPDGFYHPWVGVIHSDCTSGYVIDGTPYPNIPCDYDNDGVVDPPPDDPIEIPDDPDEDHPPGIDNGNCPGQRFYNFVLVRFRGLIGLGCFEMVMADRGDFAQGIGDDAVICAFDSYGGGTVQWFGVKWVRYAVGFETGGTPPCDYGGGSATPVVWLSGRLEVTVIANFTGTPPFGWHVTATLYTDSHGFFGEVFTGGNPPEGDCAGVTGLPNDYDTPTPGATIIMWSGFADVLSANSVLPP
jgi:hypothetical protein